METIHMSKITKKTNPQLISLIVRLKEQSHTENAAIWKTVANRLDKPTRAHPRVNLGQISRHTGEGEVILVPGKVLGSGLLNHAVTVAALAFSESAKARITDNGGEAITINALMDTVPKGTNVRIMG
ncbi:MAG: 50S ribosomal protein L18e [Methanosarcinales archaeon]|nr:50S ribosomal protein L18e [Methanosarcinales archaeon]